MYTYLYMYIYIYIYIHMSATKVCGLAEVKEIMRQLLLLALTIISYQMYVMYVCMYVCIYHYYYYYYYYYYCNVYCIYVVMLSIISYYWLYIFRQPNI